MQNKPTPTEGQNSTKLEAESALRGAACCASSIPFGADLTNVAEENSSAADAILSTGKLLVDVPHNLVPSEGLEKGSPTLGTDEAVGRSRAPDWNDDSSQARVAGTCLEGVDDVVLVSGGLGTEGRVERDDNHIDPLLSEVGNLESIHGGVGDSSFLHNVEHVHPLPASGEDALCVSVQITMIAANTAAGSGLHDAACSASGVSIVDADPVIAQWHPLSYVELENALT